MISEDTELLVVMIITLTLCIGIMLIAYIYSDILHKFEQYREEKRKGGRNE